MIRNLRSAFFSYLLCPPKGEAAVRLLWFSYYIIFIIKDCKLTFCFQVNIGHRTGLTFYLPSPRWPPTLSPLLYSAERSSDNCRPISEPDLSSELLISSMTRCLYLPSAPWFSHPDYRGLITGSEVEIRRTVSPAAHNSIDVLGICDSCDQWLATEVRQETVCHLRISCLGRMIL